MEKRLKLAKSLLSGRGVIFISIDDNEQSHLKILCDEIFGEENFIANFIWKSKSGGAGDSKHIAIDSEYILLYSKNIKKAVFNKQKSDFVGKYKDKNFNKYGKYDIRRLNETGIRYSETLDFEVKIPLKKDLYLNCQMPKGRITIKPNDNDLKSFTWRWSKEKIERGFEKNYLIVTKNRKGKYVLNQKQYERFDTKEEIEITERKKVYRNIINEFNTTLGTKEIKELFGDKSVFPYPKPSALIKHLLKIGSNKKSVILDFFAGSGTTGHAVLQLNKEDGGNRKVILCTNNENVKGDEHAGIAQSVCYPRLKKVIKGYKGHVSGKRVEGLGGSLKYLKTDFIDKEGKEIDDRKRRELTKKAGWLIGLKEGCLGLLEFNDHYQIFENLKKDKYAIIYHNEDQRKMEKLLDKIGDKKAIVYVFSYGTPDYEISKRKNTKIKDIPQPILDIYKEINEGSKK